MDEYLKPEDSQLLDRLVDNELTDAERREVLLRLERTPDGWRRCALAFLEHQAWRTESKAFSTGVPHVGVQPTPVRVAKRHWSATTFWTPLAVAACVFVMFGTWIVLRDRSGGNVVSVPNGGNVQVVQQRPTAANAGNMRLVVDGGPNRQGEVVEVPLVEAGRMNEALFGPWSQAVPPEVLQMLERSGHQVVRERRLVPVDFRDGRRVVVPMDQVEIRPVNLQGYQ